MFQKLLKNILTLLALITVPTVNFAQVTLEPTASKFVHFTTSAAIRAKTSANFVRQRITKPESIYGKECGETNSVNDCNCEGDIVSTRTDTHFQTDALSLSS